MKRSQLMARVRQQGTGPEVNLRRELWSTGLRYRVNVSVECIRPDIVFRSARVAVFVDGCFWHGCPDHYTKPKTNPTFWARKLNANVERDIRQTAALESAGWRVLRFWEHEVKESRFKVACDVWSAVQDPLWRQDDSLRVIVTDAVADKIGDSTARLELVPLRPQLAS